MTANRQVEILRMLVSRLERLSADSHWARRASGVRGNILKVLEESDEGKVSQNRMNLLIQRGFEILEQAAQEIPDIDELTAKLKP